MLLGEFRKRTERLEDHVELMIWISEKSDRKTVIRDEIIASVNTLGFDADFEAGSVLAITDAKVGYDGL